MTIQGFLCLFNARNLHANLKYHARPIFYAKLIQYIFMVSCKAILKYNKTMQKFAKNGLQKVCKMEKCDGFMNQPIEIYANFKWFFSKIIQIRSFHPSCISSSTYSCETKNKPNTGYFISIY